MSQRELRRIGQNLIKSGIRLSEARSRVPAASAPPAGRMGYFEKGNSEANRKPRCGRFPAGRNDPLQIDAAPAHDAVRGAVRAGLDQLLGVLLPLATVAWLLWGR